MENSLLSMLSSNLRTYYRHFLNTYKSAKNSQKLNLVSSADIPDLDSHLLRVAMEIRGQGHSPAIMIHGVMPRSGTNYVGELFGFHPELHSYPNNLWEVPFLKTTPQLMKVQRNFFSAYEHNVSRMGSNDFLPLFGASLVAYLYSFVEGRSRLLVKTPDVMFLSYFFYVFPFESLLLVLRDGRDVVHSFMNTWPKTNFTNICRRWNLSARTILQFDAHYRNSNKPYLLTKYEYAFAEPEKFVKTACDRLNLNSKVYPFERIKDIPLRGSSTSGGGKVTWDAKEKPKHFNPVGHWEKWSPERKRLFKRIAGKTLIDSGYARDMDW